MRQINAQTAPLTISLPSVEDNILQLANSKYFSCLDFSQGYHHMKVHPNSLRFMYVAGPNCYVRLEYMAFGLKNAATFFTLWVRQLYEKLPMSLKQFLVIYLDDI